MTGRSIFRVVRWAGLAAVAPVLWACNARTLEAPVLKPATTFQKTFQQSVNRNVDLLFLVDDSSSMRLSQDNLNRNFPVFMNTLMAAPQGLPNLRVAVISSDMGAGDGSVASCDASGGKQGIFQYTARGSCAATNLQAGATYIENIGGVANYTGNLADVFTCIAALGETGCGFEHQFASITRALGVDGLGAPPAENQNFVRKDAYLVVILITNEDDCSASLGQGPNNRIPLFDTGSNTNMASQLGPPANFRCNEFGHTCPTGVVGTGRSVPHPDRNAPNLDMTQRVTYDGCKSDDTEGFLLSAKDTADKIKSLKNDPSQVIVAAITGPATPYTVTWKAPSTADTSCNTNMQSCPWPVIAHSCGSDTDPAGFADPGVRIADFVGEFGANGLNLPICATDFAPSLTRIGDLINASLQPPCISGQVAMKPGTQEPDCTVVTHTLNSSGNYVDKAIGSCASGAPDPCWTLNNGGTCGGFQVDVTPDPALMGTSSGQNATVNCALCTAGVTDAARGCP
jgi:hypothetical protein